MKREMKREIQSFITALFAIGLAILSGYPIVHQQLKLSKLSEKFTLIQGYLTFVNIIQAIIVGVLVVLFFIWLFDLEDE